MVGFFLNLKRYKEGKISLETLAKELDLSVSETIDLLAECGVTFPISYDDYLQGLETLEHCNI
jgi:predicted HTH domain antitoxin